LCSPERRIGDREHSWITTSHARIRKSQGRRVELTLLPPILLALAEQRSLDAVLSTIVAAVSAQADVALARVWLRENDHACPVCMRRPAGEGEALHLRASAGHPLDASADWSRVSGGFHRVALAAP